jgi:hypothetical protein
MSPTTSEGEGPVTDLERLFRALVQRLSSADSDRLYQPLPLSEIQFSILPYRTNRRAIGVDTHEDYELLLLRLAAGEGGFALAQPEDARARFVAESRSAHPELIVLQEQEAATLLLSGEEIADALGSREDDRYAPPAPGAGRLTPAAGLPLIEPPTLPPLAAAPPRPVELEPFDLRPPAVSPPAVVASVPPTADLGEDQCAFCGGALPSGRAVNFCPHCGQSQRALRCPGCGIEVELDWRHCVSCGVALGSQS